MQNPQSLVSDDATVADAGVTVCRAQEAVARHGCTSPERRTLGPCDTVSEIHGSAI